MESVPSNRVPKRPGCAGKGDDRACDVFARCLASYGLHRSSDALRPDPCGFLILRRLRLALFPLFGGFGISVKIAAGLPETATGKAHLAARFFALVIQKPSRSHSGLEIKQIGIFDALNGLKGVFEGVEEIVIADHFDIGPAEAPKFANLGELALAIFRLPIVEDMPMRPTVLLKFELPAPFAGIVHQTGVTHFAEKVAKPILDQEEGAERIMIELLRVNRQREKAPLVERRQTLGLDFAALAENSRRGEPVAPVVFADVNHVLRLAVVDAFRLAFRTKLRSVATANDVIAATFGRIAGFGNMPK